MVVFHVFQNIHGGHDIEIIVRIFNLITVIKPESFQPWVSTNNGILYNIQEL